jgi:hypothetical protein
MLSSAIGLTVVDVFGLRIWWNDAVSSVVVDDGICGVAGIS